MPNRARNLLLTNQTLHSLTVKWDAPEVGGLTGYNVTLADDSTFQIQTVGNDTTVTFTGLKPGAEYIVGVATVNGNRRSTPVEDKFFTSTYESCTYFGQTIATTSICYNIDSEQCRTFSL